MVWENQAAEATGQRAATLRECADVLRMMLDSSANATRRTITVPVVSKHLNGKVIGEMTVDSMLLPPTPDYSFTIAYKALKEGMYQLRSVAVELAAATTANPLPVYYIREIGEGDWRKCSEAVYNIARGDPNMDTKVE